MKSLLLALVLTTTASASFACAPNVGGTRAKLMQTSPASLIGVVKILPEAATVNVNKGAGYEVTTWRYGLWGMKCRLFRGCFFFRKGAAYGTAYSDGMGGAYCELRAADDVKAFR